MNRFLLLLILSAAPGAAAPTVLNSQPAASPVFPPARGAAASAGWPGKTGLRLHVEPYRSTWDGMPVAYQRLRVEGLDLVIREQALADWRPASSSAYAYAATYWWHGDVTAYFAVFDRPNPFLPSLGDDAWLAYLATVARRPGPLRPQLRVNDTSSLQLLGQPTRVLAYEIPGAGPEDAGHSVTHVYVEFPQRLLVIGLEGPPLKTADATSAFNDLLLGLELFPPPI